MAKRRPPLTEKLAEIAANIAEEVRNHEKLQAQQLAAWLSSSRTDFESLRRAFLDMHELKVRQGLEGVFSEVTLNVAPIERDVQERFMAAIRRMPDVELRPAFHGTDVRNHSSIFRHGLLIPGQGNKLSVVHGAAHGTGVYTANIDAAWLSRGFCTAPAMLVCAVLQVEGEVRHVGDAMVVRHADYVVPLFEGAGENFADAPRAAPIVMPSAPAPRSKLPFVAQLPAPSAKSKKAKDKGNDKSCEAKDKNSKFKARLAAQSRRH